MKKLLLFLFLLLSTNAFAQTTVNAGTDQTICSVCAEVTLFGSARNASDVPQDAVWTIVSGPAAVTFSAKWAETTSVTITTQGTYVFRLTSGVTIDDVIVVKNASAAEQEYYVDPYYTGGSNTGSSTNPWTTISFPGTGTGGTSIWSTINGALATKDVVIYFTSRQASSDIAAVTVDSLYIWRTDAGTHTLTLDGKSKYQTNTTHSSSATWTSYLGSNKHQINPTGNTISIGQISENRNWPQNYTTIRGFDTTGVYGAVGVGGDYITIEYISIHDTAAAGGSTPTLFFHTAVDGDTTGTGTVAITNGLTAVTGSSTVWKTGTSTQLLSPGSLIVVNSQIRYINTVTDDTHLTTLTPFSSTLSGQTFRFCQYRYGNHHNITFRNNSVSNGTHEGMYIGGNYLHTSDGGCYYWGNAHDKILIESNSINMAQSPASGENDAMDLKAGLTNLTVRGNELYNVPSGIIWPIVFLGVYPAAGVNTGGTTPVAHTNALFENNYIHDNAGYDCMRIRNQFYTIVRNNVMDTCTGDLIYVSYYDVGSSGETYSSHVNVVNNTGYNLSAGIGIFGGDNAIVKNNLMITLACSGGSCAMGGVPLPSPITSDHNAYPSGTSSDWTDTSSQTSISTDVANAAGGDFHLLSGKPEVNNGTNNPLSWTVDLDKAYTTRPVTTTIDIGAYEYCTSTCGNGSPTSDNPPAASPTGVGHRVRLRKP